jgi:hypothetical protein
MIYSHNILTTTANHQLLLLQDRRLYPLLPPSFPFVADIWVGCV